MTRWLAHRLGDLLCWLLDRIDDHQLAVVATGVAAQMCKRDLVRMHRLAAADLEDDPELAQAIERARQAAARELH